MNKDHKLMAGLIPVILMLSIVLYISPDVSGLTTDIPIPLLNQTDNSSLTPSSNITSSENQIDPLDQNSQEIEAINDYGPTDPSDTDSGDGDYTEPTEPDETDEPTETDEPSEPDEPTETSE